MFHVCSNICCGCVKSLVNLRHPGITSHTSRRAILYYCVPMCVFLNVCTFFSGARGSCLALSVAGHAGGPPVHGATLVPGRAPWRVPWAFKSREIRQVIAGSLSAKLEPSKTIQHKHVSCFGSTAVKALLCGNHGIQQQSHVKFVWTATTCVWTLHMLVCAACATTCVRVCRCVRVHCICLSVLRVLRYVCVCVDACGSVCAGTSHFSFLFFSPCLLLPLLPYHVCNAPSLKRLRLKTWSKSESRLLRRHDQHIYTHVYSRIVIFLFALLYCCCRLPKHVCITPCLQLSSSLPGGSHGTTAVAQQVCVDQYLLCGC